MIHDTTTPNASDIRLDLVSMNEWRVCDRRFDEHDSRCVLGYIERRNYSYRVTTLRGRDDHSFGSLASATSSFTEEITVIR